MKRDKVPMIAHIIFLVLLIVGNGAFGFFNIGPVVLAIAVSSWIMAFAEFFRTYETYYKEAFDIGKPFVVERRKMIQADIKKIEIMKCATYNSCNIDLVPTPDMLSEWIEQCEAIGREIDGIDANNQFYYKQQKKYRFISNILTCVAYLAFLFILYQPLKTVNFENAEGILSLIGALVALCTQYMNGLVLEKTSHEKMLEKKVSEAHDTYRTEIDKYYAALIKSSKTIKVKVRKQKDKHIRGNKSRVMVKRVNIYL